MQTKLFLGARYLVPHSSITPENAAEMLKSDIRSWLLGVQGFLYANPAGVELNDGVRYLGGFYYEAEETGDPCQDVVNAEASQIERADWCVFLLNHKQAIATVSELIYASSLPGKRITAFIDPDLTRPDDISSEYWFPIRMAQHAKGKGTSFEVNPWPGGHQFVEYIKRGGKAE